MDNQIALVIYLLLWLNPRLFPIIPLEIYLHISLALKSSLHSLQRWVPSMRMALPHLITSP